MASSSSSVIANVTGAGTVYGTVASHEGTLDVCMRTANARPQKAILAFFYNGTNITTVWRPHT